VPPLCQNPVRIRVTPWTNPPRLRAGLTTYPQLSRTIRLGADVGLRCIRLSNG